MNSRSNPARGANLWIMGIALALALGGCANDQPATQPLLEEDEVRSLVTDDEDISAYFDLNAVQSEPDVASPSQGSPVLLARIRDLLNWKRDRHQVSQEISISMSEGFAYVTHVVNYEGYLALLDGGEGGSQTGVWYRKDLAERAERRAVFSRMPESQGPDVAESPQAGWRLVSISPIEVESRTGGALPTVGLARLQVDVEGQTPWVLEDAEVSAPLAIERLLTVQPGNEVLVTIQTRGQPNAAFLHLRSHRNIDAGEILRVPMTPGPEGTFTCKFNASSTLGRFHLSADLLSEGSLYESDPVLGPYDANIWGVPFDVVNPDNS